MSTSSTSPLSSSSSSSTNLAAPLTFNGLSTYSSDFQQVLQRDVAIAQLPLQALQNQQADIQDESTALTNLEPDVAAVGSALSALGKLGSSQALSAESSNSSLVSVTNNGSVTPGTYTISNIQYLAAAASETSTIGYADSDSAQVSANGNLSLVVGKIKYPITLGSGNNQPNTLQGLQNAINALGAGVTASILTTGTGANPDYLSISANATGATTLQLNDIPTSGTATNLLTAKNQGQDAQFDLNNVPVTNSSNTINNVIPGMTFTLENTTSGTQSATLSTSTDPSQLSSALQTLVAAYNQLAGDITAQTGTSGGPLTGNAIINQIQQDLQQTVGYSGTSGTTSNSTVKSLSDLGISIDDTGQMSFDQSTFDSLSSTQIADGFKFLGSSSTGIGALAQTFTELTDPVSGLITLQQSGYTQTNQELTDQITNVQNQVAQLQTNVQSQLEAADSLIAEMQSQQQVITASVQAVDYSIFGQNYGSTTTTGGG